MIDPIHLPNIHMCHLVLLKVFSELMTMVLIACGEDREDTEGLLVGDWSDGAGGHRAEGLESVLGHWERVLTLRMKVGRTTRMMLGIA
jgi:hypothetical protein